MKALKAKKVVSMYNLKIQCYFIIGIWIFQAHICAAFESSTSLESSYRYQNKSNQIPYDSSVNPYLNEPDHHFFLQPKLEFGEKYKEIKLFGKVGLEQELDMKKSNGAEKTDRSFLEKSLQNYLFTIDVSLGAKDLTFGLKTDLNWNFKLEASEQSKMDASSLRLIERQQNASPYLQYFWNSANSSQFEFLFRRVQNPVNPEKASKNLVWHQKGNYLSFGVNHLFRPSEDLKFFMGGSREDKIFQDFWYDHSHRMLFLKSSWRDRRLGIFQMSGVKHSLSYWQPSIDSNCGASDDYGLCARRINAIALGVGYTFLLSESMTFLLHWKHYQGNSVAAERKKLLRQEIVLKFDWTFDNKKVKFTHKSPSKRTIGL